MLRGENLSFSYEKNKRFIEELDIDIPKGKITTILGPNGSGKSTLLSLLSTYNKPLKGNVFIENINLNTLKCKDIAKEIATVHQQNEAPEDVTVEKLISYGRAPHNKGLKSNKQEDEKIIDWAISCTNLDDIREKNVMSLSGGQRQRAFIAMALAQNTKVLLLDEPTTYLDIYHQIELLELVKELKLKEKLTIVMVLHDINQALSYSDNIIVMKNGELISAGKAEEVISMKLLNDVYNIGGFLNTHNDNVYFVPMKKQKKNCF